MMRVSAKGEYAIFAILTLARIYHSDEVRTLEEISIEESIPHPFLVQIIQELKRGGLVDSKRGAGGGYRLTKPPKEISVGEVIRLIDGPLLPFKCISPVKDPTDDCVHEGNCVMSSVWLEVRNAIEKVINNVTFEDLIRRGKKSNSPMYHI